MDEYSSRAMNDSPDGGAQPLAGKSSGLGYDELTMKGGAHGAPQPIAEDSSSLGYDEPTMKGDVHGAAPTADADDGYDEPTMREAPPRPIGPRVGDRLVGGRYEVLSELGRGGMGVVYRCLDGVSGIEVALKALPPEVAHNREEMEDVRDNFQLVSKLVHQNIAAVRNLEKGDSIGDYYIVMELVTGENLRQWMRRTRREKGEITIDDAMPILRQVAEALDYAHGKKVMHRDVKPGNIMLSSDGQAKVMDFGLAAQIHSSLSHVSLAYHGTSGTQSYMAPEQWRGKAQGAAADQYALAVMAYEMLSGHLPFDAVDADVLKKAVLEETADPIDGLPESSNRALQRALSKNAADRFPNCRAFMDALGGGRAKVAASSAPPADDMQLQKEVYLWKAALAKTNLAIDGGNYDRGQTFGGHLDSLQQNFTAGAEVMGDGNNAGRFKLAHEWYGKAMAEVRWLEENAPLREQVRQQFSTVEEAKTTAAAKDCETLAPSDFSAAEKNIASARDAFEEGRFKEAIECLSKANDGFSRAMENARLANIQNLLAEGRKALAEKRWKDASAIASRLIALDANNADAARLKTDAESGVIQQIVEQHLSTARKQIEEKDWDNALQTAEEIIAIDANNQEVGRIKDVALENQATTLSVMVEADGKTVLPMVSYSPAYARMLENGVELEYGRTYHLTTTYVDGNEIWKGSMKVTADWKGHRERTIHLQKDIFNGVVTLPGNVAIEFIKVEAGSFMMGSPDDDKDHENDETLHRVTLTKDFWLGKYAVTQKQYKAVMETNPSYFQQNLLERIWKTVTDTDSSESNKWDNKPVEYVSWDDAKAFCKKLTELERNAGRLPNGYVYDLPTEAQWEFAARGGNQSRNYKYSGSDDIDEVAWYDDNSEDTTHPVGQKKANELGLYDMGGNVWEWCLDWYGDYGRKESAPKGASSGSHRVCRGGGWKAVACHCRAVLRGECYPWGDRSDLGFRLALVPVQ